MKPVFIFGLPRSGTTWLSKIFDSHPQVLLRHEPDVVNPTLAIPFVLHSSEIERHLSASREYLLSLIGDRRLRCVSNQPYFRKSYRSPTNDGLRKAMILLFEGMNLAAKSLLEKHLRIPDLVRDSDSIVPVVKSVDSVGRLPLFAKACPECRFIYIIRHPCGMASSKIRGETLGKIGKNRAFKSWLRLDSACSRDLSESDLATWSDTEISAWQWLLFNEFVIEQTRDLANVRVVVYDELCRNPLDISRDLFHWAGLGWDKQCADYINKCIAVDRDSGANYYSTTRNPISASTRWMAELSESEKETISGICNQSPVAGLFPD